MGILSWIVVGAIAGWLAGMLVKGDESPGFIGHIGLGIVGGLVGGLIAALLTGGKNDTSGIHLPTIAVLVVCAIIVVVASSALSGGTRTGGRHIYATLPLGPT